MHLGRRDLVATVFVVVGVLAYALWLADHPTLGLSSVRAVTLVVLGTGVAASALSLCRLSPNCCTGQGGT